MQYIHFTCVTAWPFEFSAEHLFAGPENQKAFLFYLLSKWKFCIFTEQLKTVPSTSCKAALCLLSSTVEWAKYSCSLLTNTFSLLLDLLYWGEKHNNLLNIQATKIKQFANDLVCRFFSGQFTNQYLNAYCLIIYRLYYCDTEVAQWKLLTINTCYNLKVFFNTAHDAGFDQTRRGSKALYWLSENSRSYTQSKV